MLAEKQTGNTVTQEKVNLIWGGKFEVDAVVKSNNIIKEVHCLSVSEYKTAGNNSGSGKLQKIKADALMMMGIKCDKKVLAFLGETMYKKVKVCRIKIEDVKKVKLSLKEKQSLEYANLTLEGLAYKYFDKVGNVYELFEDGLYLYNIKVKKLVKKDMVWSY